ncbi:MAG: hypothetical protein GXY83_39530 [Rhodopirellula sp.]|nr:hypothetical protein [Rhodopirellula sp.]
MSTEEQAKKEIVAALRALRVILTQGPRREYPDELKQHPEVRKLNADIERALAPYSRTLDPRDVFRYFVPCDVLTLTELPADWETLKWLDHYIERYGDATVTWQSQLVKLFGPGEEPEVNGKRKPILTAARYDTVQALVEAGETGLTKDQLDHKSGHTDARKLLKALADGDADWAEVILFPGTPGKGYRIR